METEKKPSNETEIQRVEIDKAGGPIELEKAKEWSNNYRKANRGETISHLFGRSVIEKILSQKDCAGIRIYYGYSEQERGKKQLILVGTDKFGNNQLPHKKPRINAKAKDLNESESLLALGDNDGGGDDGYSLYDQSWPCPGTKGCPSNDLTSV